MARANYTRMMPKMMSTDQDQTAFALGLTIKKNKCNGKNVTDRFTVADKQTERL